MKSIFLSAVIVSSAFIPAAFASDGAKLGEACAIAAVEGNIELPESMSVDQAQQVCKCMGEKASEAVAVEIKSSLSVYDLDERMGELSDDARTLFQSCAAS